MDLRQRQQPTGQTNQRVTTQPSLASPSSQPSSSGLSKRWTIVVGVLLALSLIGLVAYQMLGVGSLVDKSKYQAVFLSNDQVYFGKLHGWGGAKPYLTDVYYFQAAGEQADNETGDSQTLVKLGEEIHKPTDKLILNSDAVLFVENIENDGQVAEAIETDKESE